MDSFDPCDEFLQARHPPGDAGPLRERLLRETTGVLRRRRYLRRGLVAAALAACYVAGLATTWLGRPAPPVEVVVKSPELRAEEPAPPQREALSPADEAGVPAPVLERLAELADRRSQAALFRRAGDRYLEAEDNVASALRCYRLALELASESELAVAPEDTWLLIALKDARQKEREHGARGG